MPDENIEIRACQIVTVDIYVDTTDGDAAYSKVLRFLDGSRSNGTFLDYGVSGQESGTVTLVDGEVED